MDNKRDKTNDNKFGDVCSTCDHVRNAYRFVGNIKGPGRGYEHNIKVVLKETRCEDLDWIQLVEDRIQRQAFVITVMSFEVP